MNFLKIHQLVRSYIGLLSESIPDSYLIFSKIALEPLIDIGIADHCCLYSVSKEIEHTQ